MGSFERHHSANTMGVFNYLDETVTPSLFRNGGVRTHRDSDGNDYDTVGLKLEEKRLLVTDARGFAEREQPSCAHNGFELLQVPLDDNGIDFFDHDTVVRHYYRECEQLVAASTRARAYAFDHNIRSAAGKQARTRITGGQQVQDPLHMVHGDYTLHSAPQRLSHLARPPSGNDTLGSLLGQGESLVDPGEAQLVLEAGRFAIINVWRNIANTPVAVRPLALCDARSVAPQDLVVFEIHYQDRVGENYFARFSPAHRWLYYSDMTRAEALLIKQWDSNGVLAQSNGVQADADNVNAPCTFSFHSAFDDPSSVPDAPDRWSIEVRCVVLYD